ncbi:hypothetical protein [Geodermatophilus sp. SYSU D01119]
MSGLPSPDDLAAAERGEVVLGGCVLVPGPEDEWACPVRGRELFRATT